MFFLISLFRFVMILGAACSIATGDWAEAAYSIGWLALASIYLEILRTRKGESGE